MRQGNLKLLTILCSLMICVNALLATNTSISSISFPPQNTVFLQKQDTSTNWNTPLNYDQTDYELGVFQHRTELFMKKEFTKNKVIYLGAGFERHNVNHDDFDLLKTPFNKTNTLLLNSKYSITGPTRWGGYASGSLDLATNNQTNYSDGFSMIASAGASYTVNPKLKFSFGLLTTGNLLSKSSAIPMIGIDWDITERLKLRTLNGAFLTYDVSQSTQMDVSVQYRDQSFAIENMQGTIFMQTDNSSAVEESSVVGTLGVRHHWKDVFSIRAFAEIVGNREFEILLDKNEIQTIPEAENNISFGVEGGIRF